MSPSPATGRHEGLGSVKDQKPSQLGKATVFLVLVCTAATVVTRFFVPIVAVVVLVIAARLVWTRTRW